MAAAATKAATKAKEDEAVLRFEDAYREALAEARVSAEHTATEGWQGLYGEHRKADRKARQDLAGRLRWAAETIESRHLTEEEEKIVKDAIKAAVELRETAEVFDRKTVEPVRRCVERCKQVIDDAKAAAERAESSAPLTSRGVGDRIRAAIAAVPAVKWDAEKGRVVVEG